MDLFDFHHFVTTLETLPSDTKMIVQLADGSRFPVSKLDVVTDSDNSGPIPLGGDPVEIKLTRKVIIYTCK